MWNFERAKGRASAVVSANTPRWINENEGSRPTSSRTRQNPYRQRETKFHSFDSKGEEIHWHYETGLGFGCIFDGNEHDQDKINGTHGIAWSFEGSMKISKFLDVFANLYGSFIMFDQCCVRGHWSCLGRGDCHNEFMRSSASSFQCISSFSWSCLFHLFSRQW